MAGLLQIWAMGSAAWFAIAYVVYEKTQAAATPTTFANNAAAASALADALGIGNKQTGHARTASALAITGWMCNGLSHLALCGYMALCGEGDLSFFSGPFSGPGTQVQNLIAIPLTAVFFGWAQYAKGSTVSDGNDWKRYLVPIVFYGLGWLTVWPKFLFTDQFVWPAPVTECWVLIWWSEMLAFLGSLVYVCGGSKKRKEAKD